MPSKSENNRIEQYLRTDLSAEENQRLTEELENNPALLRELLLYESPEDQTFSDTLLFDNPNLSEQEQLDSKIRRYLLCDPTFPEEEIAELEDLIIDDERYFERMTLVESELMEDYSRGALPADERQRFKDYFLITPERREKLNLVEAMALSAATAKQMENDGFPVVQNAPASTWWESLLAFMRSSNLFAGAAAASVLLFLVVGALLWFSQRTEREEPLVASAPINKPTQSPNQPTASTQPADTGETGNVSPAIITPTPTTAIAPQPTKSQPINQEQKRNENPAPTPIVKPTVNPPSSVVFAFSVVGLTRSGGNSVEKKIEPGTKVVALQLPLEPENKYDDYVVVVQDSDGKEVGRREKLKATKKGNSLIATLPAIFFKPDDYTVILSGGTKGSYEEAARYSFRVLK